jgi:hypothetical protein
MPQISSTDILLVAANDRTGALKNPHPDVPFATIGDDIISALSQLATIFKNNFQKPSAPELIQAPVKAAENKQPSALVQPILTSPMTHNYQTRSQQVSPTLPANVSQCQPVSQLAITSEGGHTSCQDGSTSEGADTGAQPFSKELVTRRLFGYGKFQAISLGTNLWTNIQLENDVVHPVTGKEMEYKTLLKDPVLQPLLKRVFGNEVGRLFQGIRNIQGTNTCFCVELTNIPKYRQITYKKIVCDYKPHKKGGKRVRLTAGATDWIIPAKWRSQPQTSQHSKF